MCVCVYERDTQRDRERERGYGFKCYHFGSAPPFWKFLPIFADAIFLPGAHHHSLLPSTADAPVRLEYKTRRTVMTASVGVVDTLVKKPMQQNQR